MKPLAVVLIALIVLSVVGAILQQQASALSAVSITNRGTVNSVNPSFKKVYHDTGATAIQFLDIDGNAAIAQNKFNLSTNSTTAFTNPAPAAIVRNNPSSMTSSSNGPATYIVPTTNNDDATSSETSEILAEHVVNVDSQINNLSVTGVTLKLKKSGTPTGTAIIGVWDGSGILKKTFGTQDVSALTTSFADYTYSSTAYVLQVGDYIGISFTGGSSIDRVDWAIDTSNPFDSFDTVYAHRALGTWYDYPANDATMTLTSTPTTAANSNDNTVSTYWSTGGADDVAAVGGSINPTSQYRFNGNGIDSIASNNLTPNGSPTYRMEGPYGFYTILDGSSKYFTAGSSAIFDVTTGDFSFAFALKRNAISGSDENIISKRDQNVGTNQGYVVKIRPSNNIQLQLGGGGAATVSIDTSGGPVNTANIWYIVGASFNRGSNTASVWVYNTSTGALTTASGDISSVSGTATNTQVFTVGRASYTNLFYCDCDLDQLTVWSSTAITQAEFRKFYQAYIYADNGSTKKVTSIDLYSNQVKALPQKLDVYVSNSTSFPEAARQTVTMPTSGLLQSLRFENTPTDSSGNRQNPTLVNSPAYTTGKYGSGLDLESSSTQYGNLPVNSLFETDYVAVSVWLKPESTGTQVIVDNRSDGGSLRYEVYLNGQNKVGFQVHNGLSAPVITGATVIPTGTWTHIAATFDGIAQKIYVNGVLDGTGLLSGTIQKPGTTRIFIGGENSGGAGNTTFDGVLDEFRIYGRSLSQPEIQDLMQDSLRYYRLQLSTPVVGQYVKIQVNTWGTGINTITANEIKVNSIEATASNGAVSDIEITNSFYSIGRNSIINGNLVYGRTLNTDNLLGWWSFDDNSSVDSGSGSNNASPQNGATYATGKFGTSARLDGDNDYYQVGNPANLKISSGSILAWIKTAGTSVDAKAIVAKSEAYGMFLDNNVFKIYDWGGGGFRSTGVNLADGAWHLVGMTFQSGVGSGTVLYIDGNPVLTTTMSVFNQNNNFEIGSNMGTQNFFGWIDDVRVYTRILSATEIANIYSSNVGPAYFDSNLYPQGATQSTSRLYIPLVNATGNGDLKLGAMPKDYGTIDTTSGLVLYQKFDEGSGTSATDSSTIGNTGTLTNGPTWVSGIRNKALSFSGSAYVALPSDFINFNNDFTIVGWIKSTGTGRDAIFCDKPGGGAVGICLLQKETTSSISLWYNNGGGDAFIDGATGIDTTGSKWYNVAVTKSGSSVVIYVNGASDGTGTASGNIDSGQIPQIGQVPVLADNNWKGSIDDLRVYNRALSASEIKALYYGEYPLYTGTGAVPVTNNQAKAVVVSDGSSEVVYTGFISTTTKVRIVKFATATQTATLLPTALTSTTSNSNFQMIPLNGKIVIVTGDYTYELSTATDTITKVFPNLNEHDVIVSIPADFETWITRVPQTFTISTSARTYSGNAVYLGSNYEAMTYTPSTAAGPTRAALFAETLQPGLNTGQIRVHRPAANYLYMPYLSLSIEPSGTTWTLKNIGSSLSIAMNAKHEFVQTVVSDPYHAYEGVNYIYCNLMNWNVTIPMVGVGNYDDCKYWHVFSYANVTADPVPRSIPFTPTASPVHAFGYTHYFMQLLTTNDVTKYLFRSSFNGTEIDEQTFDNTGIAEQRYLNGNCYDTTITNKDTLQTVLLGNICANGIIQKTIDLRTLVFPKDWLGGDWQYSINRTFGGGNNGNSTVQFDTSYSIKPYNASIYVTDNYIEAKRTFGQWHNFTNINGISTVVLVVPDNQTLFYSIYSKEIPRVAAVSSGKTVQVSLGPFGASNMNVVGLPAAAFFLVLLGSVFYKSNSNTGLLVVAGAAGIMSAFGMIVLSQPLWGLLLIITALGVIIGYRRASPYQ